MNLPIGTFLHGGTYKIIRQIGSGGFSVTYEAEHVMLRKRVAVKEFFVKDFCNRDDITSHVTVGTQSKVALVGKLKKKFIDEAIAISQLDHPNIIKVSDVFEDNGTAYYVMNYIDGLSLNDVLKRDGKLPEKKALKYILQVAEALKCVHSQNRLHLDIKPGNIMVDDKDDAILIDFGASKQYDEENGENTSTLLGKTLGYAPIEQMGNSVQKFTPATDIYALGATLYKLITGITPPEATLLASGEELQPIGDNISDNVKAAIKKSMELNKSKRTQSVDAFVRLLKGGSKTKSQQKVDSGQTGRSKKNNVETQKEGSEETIVDTGDKNATPTKSRNTPKSKAENKKQSKAIKTSSTAEELLHNEVNEWSAQTHIRPDKKSDEVLEQDTTEEHKSLKILAIIAIAIILLLIIAIPNGQTGKTVNEAVDTTDTLSVDTLVAMTSDVGKDIGLSVLWCFTENEANQLFSYKEAKAYITPDSDGLRLPTEEEFKELYEKCEWYWVTNGFNIVGPNGESIFLSACGSYGEGEYSGTGEWCEYWTSTPGPKGYGGLQAVQIGLEEDTGEKFFMDCAYSGTFSFGIFLVKDK